MYKRKQIIKIVLMILILIISIILVFQKNRNEYIVNDDIIYKTQTETTSYILPTKTTTASQTETTTETEKTTITEKTTTSTAEETDKIESTSEETTETTIITTVSETKKETEKETEETKVTEAKESEVIEEKYGPFQIIEISELDIVDPDKDYADKMDPLDYISINSSSRGIVRIHYQGTDEYKVRIEKGDEFYNYDLLGNGNVEVFPLQMGSGSYRVLILKKIADTKYTALMVKKFDVEISDARYVYLNSIQNIYWRSNMEPINFARNDLISDILNDGVYPREELDIESFKALWSYIIRNIVYDKDKYSNINNLYGYVPSIVNTYNERKGICYDYASFMAATLRSFGLPVKLITGYCPTYYGDGYHAWNEVYIDGKWILVDVTYDAAYFQIGKSVNYEKKSSLYSKSKEF